MSPLFQQQHRAWAAYKPCLQGAKLVLVKHCLNCSGMCVCVCVSTFINIVVRSYGCFIILAILSHTDIPKLFNSWGQQVVPFSITTRCKSIVFDCSMFCGRTPLLLLSRCLLLYILRNPCVRARGSPPFSFFSHPHSLLMQESSTLVAITVILITVCALWDTKSWCLWF